MYDRYQTQAQEAKPPGYVRVTHGTLRPDDLVWSIMESKYRRADDPEWLFPATDLEFICYAIRYVGKYPDVAKQIEKPEIPTPAPSTSQRDLFTLE